MAQQNSLARSLHDLGLAAWFGGSLMGAVGVNGAAGEVDQPTQRARVANAGWARWTPVNMVGIVAHLLGALVLTRANRGRMATQRGVRSAAMTKAVLTGAALGATAYSRVLGQRVMSAGDVPVEGGAEPSEATPPEVAKAQQRLRVLQWVIPGLTGAMLVVNARMGEQQRPMAVAQGVAQGALDSVTGTAQGVAKGALDVLAGAAEGGAAGGQLVARQARRRLLARRAAQGTTTVTETRSEGEVGTVETDERRPERRRRLRRAPAVARRRRRQAAPAPDPATRRTLRRLAARRKDRSGTAEDRASV